MSLATIENGFRKTGICPFNPEAMDKTRLILMDNNNGTIIFIITTHIYQIQHCCKNMENITPLHASSPTEDLGKRNSKQDFNIHPSEETPPLPRPIENILV